MGILNDAIASLRSGASNYANQGTGPAYEDDPFAPGSVTPGSAILKAATSIAATGRAKANYDQSQAAAKAKAALDTQKTLADIADVRAQTAERNAKSGGGFNQTLTLPGDQASMGDYAGPPAPIKATYTEPDKYLGAQNTMSEMAARGQKATGQPNAYQNDQLDLAWYRAHQGDQRDDMARARLGQSQDRLNTVMDTATENSARAGIKAWQAEHAPNFQAGLKQHILNVNSSDPDAHAAGLKALGIPADDWDAAESKGKQGALIDTAVKRLQGLWADRQTKNAEENPAHPLHAYAKALKGIATARAMRTEFGGDGAAADNSDPLGYFKR